MTDTTLTPNQNQGASNSDAPNAVAASAVSEPVVVKSSPISVTSAEEEMIDIEDVLNLAIEKSASDIHLAENSPIALRVNGEIHFIDSIPKLSKKQAEHLILEQLMENNKVAIEDFIKNREADFAYECKKDGTPFRCNGFFKRNCISAVLRRIERNAKTIDELGLPEAVYKFTSAKQGLVLVTGPTGSGKSTTMCALLEEINRSRVEHILTIEDPIELIFQPKKSIFSQRELHHDTLSFPSALRASLREDPDVVMIGELRDAETTTAALNLSETGHLVFSTLHTSGASQTISRILSSFPPSMQVQVRARLADSLLGVLSQRLVPKIAGGRIGIFELIIMNGALRNIVRSGEMSQMDNAIQTGSGAGMISMQRYAYLLVREGIIAEENIKHFFEEE